MRPAQIDLRNHQYDPKCAEFLSVQHCTELLKPFYGRLADAAGPGPVCHQHPQNKVYGAVSGRGCGAWKKEILSFLQRYGQSERCQGYQNLWNAEVA